MDYREIDDRIQAIFLSENARAGEIVRCLAAMKEAQKHWSALPTALWHEDVARAVIRQVYTNVWNETLDEHVLQICEEITSTLNSRIHTNAESGIGVC